jgi:hypothetical protein
MTIWRPIPAIDGDDGRPAPEGFVGAATMTTNLLLPAPSARGRRGASSTCRARPVSIRPARPADGPDRVPHQLTPATGGAGRPARAPCPHRAAMIGIADPARAETDLAAGALPCPRCTRPLHPWGHARTRTVRPRLHHAGPAPAAGPLPHLQGHPRAAARRGCSAPRRHHRGDRVGVAGQRPRDRVRPASLPPDLQDDEASSRVHSRSPARPSPRPWPLEGTRTLRLEPWAQPP